jgi:hypothetical protein
MARTRVPDAVQRSSRCSAEPGPMTVTDMDPGSAADHHSASKTRVNALTVLRSVRGTATSTGAGILQHLMYVDHDAVGVAGGGGNEEGFRRVFGSRISARNSDRSVGSDRLAVLLEPSDRERARARLVANFRYPLRWVCKTSWPTSRSSNETKFAHGSFACIVQDGK